MSLPPELFNHAHSALGRRIITVDVTLILCHSFAKLINYNHPPLMSPNCEKNYFDQLFFIVFDRFQPTPFMIPGTSLLSYAALTLQYEEERAHLSADHEPGFHPSGARPREGFGAVYLRHGRGCRHGGERRMSECQNVNVKCCINVTSLSDNPPHTQGCLLWGMRVSTPPTDNRFLLINTS